MTLRRKGGMPSSPSCSTSTSPIPSTYAPPKSSNGRGHPRVPLNIKSHNVIMQGSTACPAHTSDPSARKMSQVNTKSTISGRSVVSSNANIRNNKAQVIKPRLVGSPAPRSSPIPATDSQWEGCHTSNRDLRDEVATPIKSFLSSNVTPRSGSRRARVGSISSTHTGTPNGTPTTSKATSTVSTNDRGIEDVREINGLGLRRMGVTRNTRSGSVVSDGKSSIISSGMSMERDQPGWKESSPDSSPMFFYASDAKSSLSSKASYQQPMVPGKASSFVHADGEQELEMETSSSSAVSPPHNSRSKFFQANAASKSNTTHFKPSMHTSPLISPKQGSFPLHNKANIQRPTSPLKDVEVLRKSSVKRVSPRQHLPLSTGSGVHQLEHKLPEVSSPTSSSLGRRSSLRTNGNSLPRHVKSSSVSSIDSLSSQRKSIPVLVDKFSGRRTSIVTEPQSLDESSQSPKPNSPPLPLSPAKSTLKENKLDHLNELAANARRERKVLDLEISNSSLLAINRTLEREMRKQNIELRRYRRLTQAGRLSIAPSNRSISSRLSSVSTIDDTHETSGSSDNDEILELELSEDDANSSTDTPLSPTAQTSHDAHLRAKDEKRLQLDLSTHQALLIDSQKINQSLKRCLALTEDLISDANKALIYRVHISDIGTAGGRVLTPDISEDDTTSQRRSMLSPVNERTSGNPLKSTGSYRRSLIGLDDDNGSGSAGTSVPTPDGEGKDGKLGFGDYLDSLGESWGL